MDRNSKESTRTYYQQLCATAKAVQCAANSMQELRDAVRLMQPGSILEGTTTEVGTVEILTNGATPQPVGSKGTIPVWNKSDQNVILKIGQSEPIAFPGTVLISIPPGQSASIQKDNKNSPELGVQVTKWSHYDPCWPIIPGTICIEPPSWSQGGGGKNGDALPKRLGWDGEITIGGSSSNGFSLS